MTKGSEEAQNPFELLKRRGWEMATGIRPVLHLSPEASTEGT